jgi:hypothetical protein
MSKNHCIYDMKDYQITITLRLEHYLTALFASCGWVWWVAPSYHTFTLTTRRAIGRVGPI